MPDGAGEPRRTWLRRLLDRPDAHRACRAVVSLLGITLFAIAAFGF